ncbi:DUF551 domain-containing protein [Enterobacter roggenkampii]|uniref:DUF551 domain-containing protein n=1 Tax=Enterobacter roggenkampii TaxID=1812935 RepID=UPI00189AC8F6|nr:DUF551 domain-containing protein [Enterobacter roggenkampii]
MSTITKEWLQQKIADMEAIRDDIPFGLGEDGTNTLAALRIALASLEAEPVAWLLSGGGAKNHVSFDSGNAYADPLREVTPLYTAHPAPVSVPAAMEMDDDFDSALEHGKAVGWNAYRAAMLQSFGNSEQLNSPVIQDGWVACSERMPEIGIKVLCFPVNDEPIHATYNGQVWLQDISWSTSDEPIDNVISCNVFHWMPLPAAPQQEA